VHPFGRTYVSTPSPSLSSARAFAFGYGSGGGVGSHSSNGGRQRRCCRRFCRRVPLGSIT